MSNLIKWNYINLERENRRIIDSDRSKKNPFPEQTASGMSLTGEEKEETGKGSFRSGMKTVNYDEVLKKEREQIEIEKNCVLSEARKQADEIISQARIISENIKNDAYESGYESGVAAGRAEASEELSREQEKLKEYQLEMEAGYQEQLRNIEPEMADFMAKMLEKLTGAIAENRKDVILYLIRTGLEHTGKSSQFIVRVSTEDYPVVEENSEQLLKRIDNQGEIIFREDKGLTKGQCVIETDTAIVESSLDVQLEKLTEDIRLMALRIED